MLPQLLEPTFLLACLGVFFLLLVILVVWMIFLSRKFQKQEEKLNLFFAGKDAKSLESLLVEEKELIASVDGDVQELFDISNTLHQLGNRSLHKCAVRRFNPFSETGSNQSFAVALLDGKGSGVVLSSLHTREGTRVFAKPVKLGVADGFPFTEEEKATIREAEQSAQEKKV
jgi:Na+-transporting methylmalonyl-CoA/oxaloacetate decarboxylase gamma subunit